MPVIIFLFEGFQGSPRISDVLESHCDMSMSMDFKILLAMPGPFKSEEFYLSLVLENSLL